MMWLPHHLRLGKGVERGHNDVSAAPPLDHCLQRYSRVHLHRGERYGDGETCLGKAECEATRCGWRTSPEFCPGKESARAHLDPSAAPLPVLYRLFNTDVVGPGIVGPDARATGPRPAHHLSGPDGAQHDARADPRYARKKKDLTTVHLMNQRGGWCGVHG